MKSEQHETSLFLTLDGMRGIGAMLVVWGHSVVFWSGSATQLPPIPFCVDLFFILSGYVIAFAYEPRLATGMTAATFMRQRLIRLYPLYLLGLLMGLTVLSIAAIGNTQAMAAVGLSLIPQLFMLPSPDFNASGDLYPLNMPSWTLLFELFANLVFVLFWKHLSTRVLVAVTALAAVVLAVCTFSYGTLDQGPSWWNFGGGFARAMFGFFCGVLVYRVAGRPRKPAQKRSWWAIPASLVAVSLTFVPQTTLTRPFIELAIVLGIGFPLVWWGQSMQPPRWIAGTFAKLGAISYAVYMVHYPLFELMKRADWRFPQLSQDWAPWTGVALMIVTLIIGWMAERYYDRPVRRALNGWYKAWEKRRAKSSLMMAPAE